MRKVLMLGWEFPPLLSGGLGIATYGIAKALCHHADIRLIIPSAGDHSDLNIRITGLNKLTVTQLESERIENRITLSGATVYPIDLAVSPYHHINQVLTSREVTEEETRTGKSFTEIIRDIFSGKEAYGFDIMHKVHLYSQLAEEIAADGDFDLIHAHDWVTIPAGMNIRNRTGKPLILHVHALETDRAGHSCRNKIYDLEKEGMEAADKIIAVSQYTKAQITEHYQIDAEKISVVHNGIDARETVRKKHALRQKLVVFLGRLTHQKGPQYLLETAEKVLKVYPNVKFVVAGAGDQFIPLLETAAYKRLGRHLIFTGFLSKAKVDDVLSMADAYFMPSVSEPFGLTALEAAQYNVPSVISSSSGAAEVLTASLKADHWDTDKYANYIVALLRYPALSKTLSDKAKHQVTDLTWDHAAEKIMHLYNITLQ